MGGEGEVLKNITQTINMWARLQRIVLGGRGGLYTYIYTQHAHQRHMQIYVQTYIQTIYSFLLYGKEGSLDRKTEGEWPLLPSSFKKVTLSFLPYLAYTHTQARKQQKNNKNHLCP